MIEKTALKIAEEKKQQIIDASIVAVGKANNYSVLYQGLDGFTVTLIHGQTLDDNLIEWHKLVEAKAQPVGVGVSVTSDGVYHSVSVWHSPSK